MSKTASVQSASQPSGPLETHLQQYKLALEGSEKDPQSLLSSLLARDEVEGAREQDHVRSSELIQHLLSLDERLRNQAATRPLKELENWRKTLQPPQAAWWWFLDQEVEERQKERSLPWMLLAGTFFLLTTTLTVEVIRRLWAGAPDLFSIFGTLLTLLLTGSPLFNQGQEVAQRALRHIPLLKARFRTQAVAGMAGLAFLFVLLGWLLLPHMADWYNNRGIAHLLAGNLTTAEHDFRRATAINPELAVASYNLGELYRRIGREDEALKSYQQAIQSDINFQQAYDGLSRLHNEQGNFSKAEPVALAGLQIPSMPEKPEIALVARYGLLSNLGWAYFAQEDDVLAQKALEAAAALENDLKKLSYEYRRALPHYYLAQVYERQDRPQEAHLQWEAALRLLKDDNWSDQKWLVIIKAKLENH